MNLNPRDFKPRSILSVFATVIALGMWRKMPPLTFKVHTVLNLDKANKSFNSSSEKSSSSISGGKFGGSLLEELGRGVGGSAMSGKATG